MRGNNYQEHENKYGSKAVAQIFTVHFPQLWSGQLVLHGHVIKENLLWCREVNSSVNKEICCWVRNSFLSRDTNNSALPKDCLRKLCSLNSESASFADGDMNPFRQGSWRLLHKDKVSGLLTRQVCMRCFCWARWTQGFSPP